MNKHSFHVPPTALVLRQPEDTALAESSLARWRAPHDGPLDPLVLSWSLPGMGPFSLTPTILQALNRIRMMGGLEPLRMRSDGTIDLPDDPLQYRLNDQPAPFAS